MKKMYSSEYLFTHDVRVRTFKEKEKAERFKKEFKKKGYKVSLKKEGLLFVVEAIKELTVKEVMESERDVSLNDN